MSKLKLTELKKFKEINKKEALTFYGKGTARTAVGSTHHDISNHDDHSTHSDSSNCCDTSSYNDR